MHVTVSSRLLHRVRTRRQSSRTLTSHTVLSHVLIASQFASKKVLGQLESVASSGVCVVYGCSCCFSEVASRHPHGLEADVWSVGCMLYTMLVGRPPFDTHGVRNTLNRVISAEYCIPEQLSPEAKHLIQSLLRKIPAERIPLNSEPPRSSQDSPVLLLSEHVRVFHGGCLLFSQKSCNTRSCRSSRKKT